MRKLFFLLILSISCNDNSNIPSGIIKPDQMQQIFWDLIRGDVLADETVKNDLHKNIKNERSAIAEKIFSIHKINDKIFQSSLAFYEKHPDLIKIIFDSLNAKQANKKYIDIEKKYNLRNKTHLPAP